MSDIVWFDQVQNTDNELVGGKGLNLALTAAAGLPVPPGFCITSAAYRRLRLASRIDGALRDAISTAYQRLGGGAVAVRSSATAEDGAVTSFAGQQETILGVEGVEDLGKAIERCWQSLHTERARAYRQHQGVEGSELAMAVVVQRLVDAEVAGVMFTRDPLDHTGSLMRIEAAWGLGEVVVSGRVTPDWFQVERSTGQIHARQTGHKPVRMTRSRLQQVSPERQTEFCLTEEQLAKLAFLGRTVEAFFGDPRDIEWAISDDRVWLLQARPITTAGASDRERIRRETIDRLARLVEPGGTVWSRVNLIEVLTEPTPMTWAIVSGKLLSGGGGTGAMYRDFGFHPDPAMAHTSAYDLIGGRPYLNLSREPRLESRNPLAGYPLAKFKQTPHLALDPKRESPSFKRQFLGLFGAFRSAAKIASASSRFADAFRNTHIPLFDERVSAAIAEDLSKVDSPGLVKRFESWVDYTLVDFAGQSLKPTLLAQFSWQVLEQQIAKSAGPERARAALTELSQGVKPDPAADLPTAILEFANGTLSEEEFLRRSGHRGPNEMELAAPRWAENPGVLVGLSGSVAPRAPRSAAEVLQEVAADAKWNSVLTKSMAGHVDRLQTYLGLRETGKHVLMRGYAIIRQTLLELDRRFGLQGGIFYLTPNELAELVAGKDVVPRIADRRRTRTIELNLEVPSVVFGDDLEVIGRPLPPIIGSEELRGIPLSAGVAEGPALVLTEPSPAPITGGYILVCPSTDPAWVPLFVNAKGLVMESGGTLSHGAIVAREFGLPAVAGLPGIQNRIRPGQRLRVDGARGIVSVIG
jgi:rifampicin phosphotransferase